MNVHGLDAALDELDQQIRRLTASDRVIATHIRILCARVPQCCDSISIIPAAEQVGDAGDIPWMELEQQVHRLAALHQAVSARISMLDSHLQREGR